MVGTEQDRKSDDAPGGAPPQADRDMNGPGMTNGVPDQASDAEATGKPGSDRMDTETAAGKEKSGG